MNKQLTNREKLLRKLQQLSDIEVEDVLDYVSLMYRTEYGSSELGIRREPKLFQSNLSSDDELLALLSSAYENRRACQVFEWEATRRKSESAKVGGYAR